MPATRCGLLALTFGLVAAVASADDLTTNGGKKLSGKLVSIDAQGASFTTGETRVTVAGKDIVLIDLGHKVAVPAKDVKYNEIELTDGSTFRAGKFSIKGRKVETELATIPEGVPAPTFELPLGSVFSIMRGAEEPKNHDAWKKILGSRGKRDMYVTREVDGLNFVQGTISGGNEEGTKLNFEEESGTKRELLLRSATGGLVFSQPAPAQVPTTICKVLDVFGNSLVAQAVAVTPEGATVTTVSGVVVKYSSPNAIAKFDYAQGNVAYLSDLGPQVDAPAVPPGEMRLNPIAPFYRDMGPGGDPIKLGNEVFAKGIVVSADVWLTFNLVGGDYRDFKALLGVPETSPDANIEVKVTIEVDGQVKFSETIKRKDKPKPIGLDVKGAKQLRVLVEADLPVNGNRVVLADARVQK